MRITMVGSGHVGPVSRHEGKMEGADGLVIAIEWDALRALDLKRPRALLDLPVMVDLRNIYPCAMVEQAGLVYHAIGC